MKVILVSALFGILILSYFALTWPIEVEKIQMDTSLPKGFYQAPVIGALALAAVNSTGNVNLSLQNFTYSSQDNKTQISGSSATMQAVITPEGAVARVDLNLHMSGVHLKSADFTGSFSSLTLTGYLLVNPTTNKLVVSLTASTSAIDIIRAFLGF